MWCTWLTMMYHTPIHHNGQDDAGEPIHESLWSTLKSYTHSSPTPSYVQQSFLQPLPHSNNIKEVVHAWRDGEEIEHVLLHIINKAIGKEKKKGFSFFLKFLTLK